MQASRVSTNRFRLLRQDDTARDARLTLSEERLRAARQQEAVAHLGQQALAGAPVAELTDAAVALAARALEVELVSLLELRPESRTLLLRAGVGWRAGAVGRTILPADADSHAGYVLRSTGQVVVEDLTTERRFGGSPLLASHGVVSSLSVLVHGNERPFGILGAHAPRRREFTIHDAHFLQAVANVLATAIDRARTEAALRSSEEHFRSLIENASDIVTVVGENGVFRYASPSVERVLGYGPSDLLERNAFDYVHPEDIALVAEALARAIQRPGSPQAAQFRFRAQDGSWRMLDAVGQARAEHGGSAHLIVNARDVTERRRQERALRENKERLRTVIAGAPLGGESPGAGAARLLRDLPVHAGRALSHGQPRPRRDARVRVRRAAAGRGPRDRRVRGSRGARAHPGALRALGRRHRGGRGDVEAPQRPGDPGAARRPRGPPRRRHHRMFRDDRGGCDRAAGARGAAAAIAEAGGDRPAHGRHRARLQQPAHDHSRQRAAARQGDPH